jgi:hypothetical protein
MVTIDEGIQIHFTLQQSSNAESTRVDILEPDSNVTYQRLVEDVKQALIIV